MICSRLIQGVRCTTVSKELHHLRSPESFPAGMYLVENVVFLCAECHASTRGGGGRDTPEWIPFVDFLPTVGFDIHV